VYKVAVVLLGVLETSLSIMKCRILLPGTYWRCDNPLTGIKIQMEKMLGIFTPSGTALSSNSC
jgi:hypothetical protein